MNGMERHMPGIDRLFVPIRGVAAALALAAVVGCAPFYAGPPDATQRFLGSNDPYVTRETSMGGNQYTVTVTAPPRSNKKSVALVALLRSAHVAESQRCRYFVVVDRLNMPMSEYTIIGSSAGAPLVVARHGVTPLGEPYVALVIRLLPNGPAPPAGALDSAKVIADLGPDFD